jgi:four helix bundle protein
MRDHRSLEAWKQSREVSRRALGLCRSYGKPFASAAYSQLQRAALSIQLNIAEGYASGGPRRFTNHLSIAYGSAIEDEELLDILTEEKLIPKEISAETLTHTRRCQRLLLGLMKRYRNER